MSRPSPMANTRIAAGSTQVSTRRTTSSTGRGPWRFERNPESADLDTLSRSPHKLLAVFFLLLFAATPALAVDPGERITQYAHSAWRTREGVFEGTPEVITQTSDGYLWIGTNIGLVRFDGTHFTPWNFQNGQRLSDPRVFSLAGGKDGSLWIGTGYGIERLRNGALTFYPQITGRIESIVEDAAGTLWLVRTQATDGRGPLCSIDSDDRVRCYGSADGVPFPLAIGVQIASAGELWIAGYDQLCRWTPRSSVTYFRRAHPHHETFASVKGIATAPDGSLWAAIDQATSVFQLQHFKNGEWSKLNFPAIPVRDADINALFVDRDNMVWVGTLHHGIWRIRNHEVDHFGRMDGLSSDWVGSFYEDAEGTIWVGTSEGIDNFRDLCVTSFSTQEGLSADGATSLVAGRDGTVWIANVEALDALRGNRISSIRTGHGLPGSNVNTLLEDHAGRLWAGIDDGLWVYDGHRFRAIRRADGSPLGIVFAMAEDIRHTIWVRAGPSSLDRIENMRVTSEMTSPQIATAYALAADPRGGLILGLVNGDLLEYRDGAMQTLAVPIGTEGARQVRDLLVEPDGSVWGTTLDGVFRVKDGVRRTLTTRNGLPCDEVFALIKDKHDALWLYSRCGLIAIRKSQWSAWWDHPDGLVRFDLFDALNGVFPGLTSLKPQTARTPDGRLWFVNGQIVQMIDPDHLRLNSRPPPVNIEAVTADHVSYALEGSLLLPARTHDLEIEYAAMSFVAPERVRFRYWLEGFDRGWHDVANRRQAFYMNIPPGRYRFRVAACNNSGVWNNGGATLSFAILPAWYQTLWFRVSGLLSLILLGYALYLLRMRQYAEALRVRFNERLDERVRIARELHDTLLQSFHGLMFKFQAVRNLMPQKPESAMQVLDEAISATERALAEGRDAIRDLRPEPAAEHDLADLFTAVGQELSAARPANGHIPGFCVIVEGRPKRLSPLLQDEIYRIGREVIRNAFHHAAAGHIEVELLYNEHELRLRIRDDGKGIDPRDLSVSERSGHWGLAGIRERAQRIGSSLKFWSEAGAGTEVEVRVPAAMAYEKPRDGRRFRLFPRGERNGGHS
jgi:signal transduction histidine kinase/ligand-binding sensor domain-containing protein